ncbi:DUF1456 family protein [Bacillus benzoevorans]|uniref:Uncharacterized protein YehS (DUF1456 family) n=1 Tax=Bacillus benzoevorans TaxID=1456 RepID=A0A7X0LUJ2_9BACI|nr:DUF1456 family protein [Bacillus benzoevorans]MBB6444490.1 uncharacterized protein YehS (DUF1456 family) [Bacillus benzoevorans]
MDNNDILIRLRYALDIKNSDMVEIFNLGGVELTKEEVLKILKKSNESDMEAADDDHDTGENEDRIECDNHMLEAFLNGFIIFKRGKQDLKPEQPNKSAQSLKSNENVNNILLKRVKIALALTSEEMLDILAAAGVAITKGELGAVLRKEGHRNYKVCGDRYARNFLKGLALKYRG